MNDEGKMLMVRALKDPEAVVDLLELAHVNLSGHWAGSSPDYGRYVVVDQATGVWIVVSDR